MSIKDLIREGYIVVFDTNVLLNVYRYSPEFSDFALECMKCVKNEIMLPSTVRVEYEKHRMALFSEMKKRIENVAEEPQRQIKRAEDKIISSCSIFKRLQYAEADQLIDTLKQKMEAVSDVLNDYFEDNASLNLIQHSWGKIDHLYIFIQDLKKANRIMPSVTQEDIYRWCEEGRERYKKQIPPGFMDAKEKDGVGKYSDLIIWKEILLYAKKKKKNVILITDDVKPDWYEQSENAKTFHSKLIEEFKKTGQKIAAMTSKEFMFDVSESYGVEQTDAIEIALNMTDKSYFDYINDSVFDSVIEQLTFNAIDYIDSSSAHIGSEGIDEFEITEWDFEEAERVERIDDKVIYEFRYSVALSGTSYDYWGRDDDTREIITSDGRDHNFEGYVIIRVEREVQVFYDFEDSYSFEEAEIISGELKEKSFSDRSEIPEPGELGYCPDCGVPLTIENDCSGFCINCFGNH